MNLTDALSTLIDAARQLPENKQLNQAVKRVEKKLDRLRDQKAMRHGKNPVQCKCGCSDKPEWLCTGFELDPYKPDNKGKAYVDEPACHTAAFYLESTSFELNLPFSKRRI